MNIEELHELYTISSGICTDTRQLELHNLFFALKGPNFNANRLADEALDKGAIATVIDDKAFDKGEGYILVDDALETLQQLANHHRRQFDIPIIGITGSNGKTTTKELIAAVLSTTFKIHFTQGNLNNHIGVPLTLLAMPTDTEIAIIEMGANHIGEIADLCKIAEPDYGIITNIGKAHLEGFGSLEGVARAKSELYHHILQHGKNIFVNSTDEHLMRMASRFKDPITFPAAGSYYECTYLGSAPYVKLKAGSTEIATQLVGEYNFTNIAAALCIGKYFKVDDEKAQRAIENYKPSNMRSQVIEQDGNTILLDAYNANPSSMKAALTDFADMEGEDKIAILGDMFELGKDSPAEHAYLGELCSELPIDTFLLCGTEMQHAKAQMQTALHFDTKEELQSYLDSSPISNSLVLVKGSRGMALETLFDKKG